MVAAVHIARVNSLTVDVLGPSARPAAGPTVTMATVSMEEFGKLQQELMEAKQGVSVGLQVKTKIPVIHSPLYPRRPHPRPPYMPESPPRSTLCAVVSPLGCSETAHVWCSV